MSICFVANKDLTVPFSDIARDFRARGERVVWLSPSTRWSKWLEAEGWSRSDILNFPDFSADWLGARADRSIAALVDIEGPPPATIGNVIQMCRNLRRKPREFAYNYLAAARTRIEEFLKNNSAEVVFGEGTWGFEHMAWLVCRRLAIPMVTPLTTRIPSDRFYFSDPVSGGLFAFAETNADDRVWAAKFFDSWTSRPVQPDYARATKGYTPFHKRWLSELAIGLFHRDLDRNDETLWPLHLRIRDRLKRAVNALLYRWAKPYEPTTTAEPYVLFCLHHQPEAAVDVYGALHSNQAALIETLSRTLPASHKLWIKEHIGALGDRAPAWHQKLARLPNVRFINPYLDIYGLLRGASLVVTISGTVGYEAALMGVPVVGLAPLYFAPLLSNRITNSSHPLEWSFEELLGPDRRNASGDLFRRSRIDFLAHLHANSFEGNPAQLATNAEKRAEPDYLRDEKNAFAAFVGSVRSKGLGPS